MCMRVVVTRRWAMVACGLLLGVLVCFPITAWARGNHKAGKNSNSNSTAAPANTAAVNAAQTQVTDAEDALANAQSALQAVTGPLKAAFEASPEMTAAISEVDNATAAQNAAMASLDASLANDVNYQAALKKKTDASTQLESLRNSGASQDQIAAAALEVLNCGTEVNRIRAAAQASDPQLAKTRIALSAANEKVLALRQQFQNGLPNNPQWAAAKKAVDDAQANLSTAKGALASAQGT